MRPSQILALTCVLACRSPAQPAPPVDESDAVEVIADLDADGLESDIGDPADIGLSDDDVPDVAAKDLPIWPGFAEMPILTVSKVIVPPGGCDPYHALPVPPGQSFAGVEPIAWMAFGYADNMTTLRKADGTLGHAPVGFGLAWSKPGEIFKANGLSALRFDPDGNVTCCCWAIGTEGPYYAVAAARYGDWLFVGQTCPVKDASPDKLWPIWLKIPVGKGCQGNDDSATPLDPPYEDAILGPMLTCTGFETFSMVALGNDKVLVLWRPDQTKLFREIAVFETGKPVATFPFDPPLPAEHAIVDLVRGNDGLIYVMLRDLQWRLRRGTFRAYSDNGKLVRDFGYVPGYPGRMAVAMDGDVYFGVHFGPIYWIEHGTTTPVPLSGTFLNEMRKYAIVVAE